MRFLLLLVALSAHAQSIATPSIDGSWHATLDAGAIKLRLILDVATSPTGLTSRLQSVDQGGAIIPAKQTTFAAGKLSLRFPEIGANFEGAFDEKTGKIAGTFTQNGVALPLTWERGGSLPQNDRPQTPKPPFPYNSEDVTFENKGAGIQLAGTLTSPKSGGPFPAVVLITGSGPQDRDESLMGHKPFLVLADHLSRNGIAVLRVDDRGTGKSTGSFASSTTTDFATDTQAALDYLKTRKEANPKLIGLIGHSEGAVIAPMVAARRSDVAFIVMMAGPGVRGDKVLEVQAARIMASMGVPQSGIDQNAKVQKLLMDAAKSETSRDAIARKVKAGVDEMIEHGTEEEKAALRTFAGRAADQAAMMASKWFRQFLLYDPAPALRNVRVPVLVLNGELDTQVDAAQNLPAIVHALEEGRNRDYTVVKFPGVNHLFQTAKTGAPAEYATIPETMSPKVLASISSWIAVR